MLHIGVPSPTKFQYPSRPCPTAPAPLDPTAPSDTTLFCCMFDSCPGFSLSWSVPVPVLLCPCLSLSWSPCPCPGLSPSLPWSLAVCPCGGLSPSVPVLVSAYLSLSWSLSLFWSLPDSVLGLGVQAIGASGALREPAGE